MNQPLDKNSKQTYLTPGTERSAGDVSKLDAALKRGQIFSENVQSLWALSDEEWKKLVDSVFRRAEREPEKYAILFSGRKHPLADTFTKVWESVEMMNSVDSIDTRSASRNMIIMGALATKRFDKLEEIGLSMQTARQQFDKKTLFCIDCVASTSK